MKNPLHAAPCLESIHGRICRALRSLIDGTLLDSHEAEAVLARHQEMIGVLDAMSEHGRPAQGHDAAFTSAVRKLSAQRARLRPLQQEALRMLEVARKFESSAPPLPIPPGCRSVRREDTRIVRHGRLHSFDWYEVQVQVLFDRPVRVADHGYTDRATITLLATEEGRASLRWRWFGRPSAIPQGLIDNTIAKAASLTVPQALRRQLTARLLANAIDVHKHARAFLHRPS